MGVIILLRQYGWHDAKEVEWREERNAVDEECGQLVWKKSLNVCAVGRIRLSFVVPIKISTEWDRWLTVIVIMMDMKCGLKGKKNNLSAVRREICTHLH